jgi:MFS family permease
LGASGATPVVTEPARRRRWLLDVEPLRRDPGFRPFWISQIGSSLARETSRVLLPLHAFLLTESAVVLGLVALAQLVPTLLLSLSGGALADSLDRRRLMLGTQLAQGGVTLVVLLVTLAGDPPIPVIILGAAAISGLFAIEHPARTSSVPRLVARERLAPAIALQSVTVQVAGLVGPALAGFLIAFVDVSAAYGLMAGGYLFASLLSTRIPALPPTGPHRSAGMGAVAEGLRYLGQQRIIAASVVLDLNAMIFGLPIVAFPVMAIQVFGVGPAEVGFLAAARGAGAFLAALTSGWIRALERVGLAVVYAVAVYGAITIVLGLGGLPYAAALVLVAVAGAVDLVSSVLRGTIVQAASTDELRGRMSAVHGLATQSGPRIGDARAAAMSEAWGAGPAVAIGGVLALAGVGVIARVFPELRTYRFRA